MDELQKPIRKVTAFLSNRLASHPEAMQRTHKANARIFKGCCWTALAAVYAKRLTQLMSQDLSILRSDKASTCPPWRPHQVASTQWFRANVGIDSRQCDKPRRDLMHHHDHQPLYLRRPCC